MARTNAIQGLVLLCVAFVTMWLFRSATSACDPRDLALIRTEGTAATFARADANGDGQLSRAEFTVAAAELHAGFAVASQTSQAERPSSSQHAAALEAAGYARSEAEAVAAAAEHELGATRTALASAAAAAAPFAAAVQVVARPSSRNFSGGAPLVEQGLADAGAKSSVRPADGPPVGGAAGAGALQCSVLIFWHVVKTAGTTMRTVLQRQAQLGEFECAPRRPGRPPPPGATRAAQALISPTAARPSVGSAAQVRLLGHRDQAALAAAHAPAVAARRGAEDHHRAALRVGPARLLLR